MAQTVWHRSRQGDLALRAGGLIFSLASGGLVALLAAHHHLHGRPPALSEVALAAIAVVLASAGASLLLLGRHLFDEITVASRWGGPIVLAQSADEPAAMVTTPPRP